MQSWDGLGEKKEGERPKTFRQEAALWLLRYVHEVACMC